MSHIVEMVEAEAAAAEAAQDDPDTPPETDTPGEDVPPGDPDTQPETEPPAEPPPVAPPSADIEALEKELDRHWKKVDEIMGADFAMFVPCPTCEEAGTPLAGMIPVGLMAPHVEYETRDDVAECGKCHGLGMMRTGSKVPLNELLPCPQCNGAGYSPVHAVSAPQLVQPGPAVSPDVQRLRDQGYTVLDPFIPAA